MKYLTVSAAFGVGCLAYAQNQTSATVTSGIQSTIVTITHQAPVFVSTARPVLYSFYPLYPPAGYELFSFNGINDSGQVVGTCRSNSTGDKAVVVWTKDQPRILPALSSLNDGNARAINNNGSVTGFSYVPPPAGKSYIGNAPHAFFWTPTAGTVDLNLPWDRSFGNAINDSDQITGYGSRGAFIWQPPGPNGPASYASPAFPPGSLDLAPNAINNLGTIVGMSWDGKAQRPFIGTAQVSRYLASGGTPYYVNNKDEALGDGNGAPVYWGANGISSALPIPGYAYYAWSGGMNDRGEIVGSGGADFDDIPIYWETPTSPAYDINLLPASTPDGWTLTDAESISNSGAIVGWANYQDTDYPGFVLMPLYAEIAVDANRDGKIKLSSESASDATTPASPFRFWINDDDDQTEVSGDDRPLGESTSNIDAKNDHVDTTRDLVDFCPVFLDIKQLLTWLPRATFKYKLKQADDALNFVYTNQTRNDALKYQTVLLPNGFSDAFDKEAGKATTHQITAAGYELSAAFLDGIKDNDWGVLLIEGRASTDSPLILSVEHPDGTIVTEVKLEIKMRPVEQFFRNKNLCRAAGEAVVTTAADRMAEPANWPDSLCNQANFVFLHGYNVNQEQSRGWGSEIFKRMYWSKSRARFYNVVWRGADSQWFDQVTVNYHINIEHAFQTAPVFAAFVNGLSGETSTAAHSLANMVVLAALQPEWASPAPSTPAIIARHFAFDAAVAAEAIEGGLTKRWQMIHSTWDDSTTDGVAGAQAIPSIYWASEWYSGFAEGDGRRRLTWRNRFSTYNNTTVYNFFSSGEEVLNYRNDKPTSGFLGSVLGAAGVGAGTIAEYTWHAQEALKGRLIIDGFLGSDYAGWDFGRDYYVEDRSNGGAAHGTWTNRPPTKAEVWSYINSGQLSPTIQKTKPLFLANSTIGAKALTSQATGNSEIISKLYDSVQGSGFAGNFRETLLASGIPSLTVPMGREAIGRLDKITTDPAGANFDLSSAAFQNGWPQARSGSEYNLPGLTPRWLHSDTREVAYFYSYKLFDKWVNLGGLYTK